MHILSFDIGIKNLSYIYFETKSDDVPRIIDWKVINIFDLLEKNSNDYISQHYKNAGKSELCLWANKDPKNTLKSEAYNILHKKYKNYEIPLDFIVRLIGNMFDSTFTPESQLDEIILENQPSLKNPKMKTMQVIIFSYWALRTQETKTRVRCVSAMLKMKYCLDKGYIDKIPKKYKEIKEKSIQVCRKILEENSHLSFFESHKKKDDLGDVLLQGLAFFQKFHNS